VSRKVLILSCGVVHRRYGVEGFAEMFARGGGLAPGSHEILDATRQTPPACLDEYSACIVTGSQTMVTRRPRWVGRLTDWLQRARERGLPILGVCFGHQLMSLALGGRVDYHPESMAVGTFDVALTEAGSESPLLRGVPGTFPAHMFHAQVVLEPPPDSEVLASCDHDPHCVLSHGPDQLSVQFHPEFDVRIMEAFTRDVDPALPAEAGAGPGQVLLTAPIRPTPEANAILPSFLALYAPVSRSVKTRPARSRTAVAS
jgi:GMP synthase (glutamine-hydrolysing)